jgi:hypothetical protein
MRVGRCGLGRRRTLEGVPTLEGGVEQDRTTSPEVIISGRNARRTVVGFLNVLSQGSWCGRLGSELEART